MHFIGMLAFALATPVTYRPWITVASAVPAVLGSAVAVRIMSRESITWWQLQVGSLALALAIGTMHYVGMEALTVDATMHYGPGMFALSIGVGLSAVDAGAVRAICREPATVCPGGRRVGGATVMGVAVAGMHYTAMAAGHFHATADHVVQPGAPPTLLAVLICLSCWSFSGGAPWHDGGPKVRHGVRFPDGDGDSSHHGAADHGQWPHHLRCRRAHRDGQRLRGAVVRLCRGGVPDADGRQGLPGCSTYIGAPRRSRWPARHRPTFEASGHTREGRTVPIELAISPMMISGRALFSAVIRDITERKEAEATLKLRLEEVERARGQAAAQAIELRHQAEELEARASGRGGEPGQERVPGQHEPRDPHADERRHRHDRAAARHASSTAEQREYAETVRDVRPRRC